MKHRCSDPACERCELRDRLRALSRAAKLAGMRDRKARLRAAGLCINSEMHGPAVNGVRCESCRVKHTESRRLYDKTKRVRRARAA